HVTNGPVWASDPIGRVGRKREGLGSEELPDMERGGLLGGKDAAQDSSRYGGSHLPSRQHLSSAAAEPAQPVPTPEHPTPVAQVIYRCGSLPTLGGSDLPAGHGKIGRVTTVRDAATVQGRRKGAR